MQKYTLLLIIPAILVLCFIIWVAAPYIPWICGLFAIYRIFDFIERKKGIKRKKSQFWPTALEYLTQM